MTIQEIIEKGNSKEYIEEARKRFESLIDNTSKKEETSIDTNNTIEVECKPVEKKENVNKPVKKENTEQVVIDDSAAQKKPLQPAFSYFPELEAGIEEETQKLIKEQKRKQQKLKADPIIVPIVESPFEPQQPVDPALVLPMPTYVNPDYYGVIPPDQNAPQAVMTEREAIIKDHKQLSYLLKDLRAKGHNPDLKKLEGGLIAVILQDKPEKSFTLDMDGALFNRKYKWIPGISPTNSEYEQRSIYSYDGKNNDKLYAWIEGSTMDEKEDDIISMNNRILNTYVNLTSLPNNIPKEDRTKLFTRLTNMHKVGVFNDYPNSRFGIDEYTNADNFTMKMLKYKQFNVPAAYYDPSIRIVCTPGNVLLGRV